jgi:actin-related protein
MVEFSTDGLGQMVFDSIRSSDATVRLQLYKNILLSGGTTMLPGFPDRLKADVVNSWKTFVRKNPQTEVKAPVEVIVRDILLGTSQTTY